MKIKEIQMILLIEIGTNTTKVLIAEKSSNNIVIKQEKIYFSRLGEDFYATKNLSVVAMERNISIIDQIIEENKNFEVSKTIIISTQVMRSAKNSQVFIEEVKKRFGIDIIVLSPEEEALCAFRADEVFCPQRDENNVKNKIIIDIGGGSTEIVYKNEKGLLESKSFPIGSVFLKDKIGRDLYDFETIENFINLTFQEIKRIVNNSIKKEQNNINYSNIDKIIGVGGTFTTLVAIHKEIEKYDDTLIEGVSMSFIDVKNILQKLKKHRISERSINIKGLSTDRADVIAFGATILLFFLTEMRSLNFYTTCLGVRHGFLLNDSL